MNIPDKLPIMRMEDYHTHYLGQCKDGRLFWAYESFVLGKEYAILHSFEATGEYITTKYRSQGSVDINQELEAMVSALGEVIYRDIEVKLFQTVIDNVNFGLVADENTRMINLQPGSIISFQEPWDGEYYT